MDAATTSKRAALDQWHAMVDAAEAALDADPSPQGLGSQAAGRNLLAALAAARGALQGLGQAPDPAAAPASTCGGPRGAKSAGTTVAQAESPAQMRQAKRSRDALLRLATWLRLGEWADAQGAAHGRRPGLVDLIVALSHDIRPAPPGVAPVIAQVGHGEADAFFFDALPGMLSGLAQRYDNPHGGFARMRADWPSGRTVLAAQRISGLWSRMACAVFADWMHRRKPGTLDAARHDLWSYGGNDCPVQFRAPDGLAVLPTARRQLQADLWTQFVPAQLLSPDAARWHEPPLDGQWHAVRLNMRDFAGRNDHGRDGKGRLFSGLAVGMLYQTLVIDRLPGLALAGAAKVPDMAAATPAQATAPIEVPLPMTCDGQRLTMRVLLEWQQDRDGGGPAASPQRWAGPAPSAPDPAAERAYQAWRAGRQVQRQVRDAAAGVQRLSGTQLRFCPCTPGEAEADDVVCLGRIDLSACVDASVLWIDVAAAGWLGSRWIDLHLQLIEDAGGGPPCSWLAVDADAYAATRAAGLDGRRLRAALADDARSVWAVRRDGLGLFMSLGVDLSAEGGRGHR